MTTTADNVRRWLERLPASATQLELRAVGSLPNEPPLATWPMDTIRPNVEAVRAELMSVAQDHCDGEGADTVYSMTFATRAGVAVVARKLRLRPVEVIDGARPAVNVDNADVVQALLKANLDQNRVIVQSVSTIVDALRGTLEAVTAQTRALQERVEQEPAPAQPTESDEDRELRRTALKTGLDVARQLVDLGIAYAAERGLAGTSALTSGAGAAETKQ